MTHGSGGPSVSYAYAADGSAAGSRFMTKITGKAGNETDLDWTFVEVASEWQATKITLDNAAGLSTEYDRSASDLLTVSNYDGEALASRVIYTPDATNKFDVDQIDFYEKTVGETDYYDTWQYAYTGRNLTTITSPEAAYGNYGYAANVRRTGTVIIYGST